LTKINGVKRLVKQSDFVKILMQTLASSLDEKRATFAVIFLPPHEAVKGEKEGKGIQEKNKKGIGEKDGNWDWR
jgi:hypothetical protein